MTMPETVVDQGVPLNPLAQPLVTVLHELVEVKRDRDVVRLMVTVALDLLHQAMCERERAQRTTIRLRQELAEARIGPGARPGVPSKPSKEAAA